MGLLFRKPSVSTLLFAPEENFIDLVCEALGFEQGSLPRGALLLFVAHPMVWMGGQRSGLGDDKGEGWFGWFGLVWYWQCLVFGGVFVSLVARVFLLDRKTRKNIEAPQEKMHCLHVYKKLNQKPCKPNQPMNKSTKQSPKRR